MKQLTHTVMILTLYFCSSKMLLLFTVESGGEQTFFWCHATNFIYNTQSSIFIRECFCYQVHINWSYYTNRLDLLLVRIVNCAFQFSIFHLNPVNVYWVGAHEAYEQLCRSKIVRMLRKINQQTRYSAVAWPTDDEKKKQQIANEKTNIEWICLLLCSSSLFALRITCI